MRTFKLFSIIVLAMLALNCSSDDDNSSQATVAELLASGRWYQESRTPGSYTDCEKRSYIQFNSNGSFMLESFEDDGDDCVSLDVMTATYTLTNDVSILITFDGGVLSAEIVSISEDLLTVTSSENETLVFDKTEG